MKIEHIAIWSSDIERLKLFYTEYFGCTSGSKYINSSKSFESYFLMFDSGCRLEIMQMPNIPLNLNNSFSQYLGLIHFAVSVGSKEKVDELTAKLRSDGYEIVGEPRITGDGYYESCILDPDGNRIEITI